MKKLTTVLMAVIVAGLTLLSACSNGGTFTERTYLAQGPIENVIIDVSDREIEVAASDDDNIHIDYFESEKEYYSISDDDGTLKMTLVFDKEWTDFIGTKADRQYRKIRIEIPDALLTALTITTTNEKINVAELEVKESIFLDSDGGNIQFEKLSTGKTIDLTAKNGDITGSVMGGWDDYAISVTIKKGESNLTDKDGGEKVLIVNCNNGDIDIDLIK